MNVTENHVALILSRECRNCGHWLTDHRTGDSPDKRPVFFCEREEVPGEGCTRCAPAKGVRFGTIWLGGSSA